MRPSLLPLLVCPARSDAGLCGGSLQVAGDEGLPPLLSDGGEDLREGLLACGRCRTLFPILSGVAILVPDPEEYVRRYRRSLDRDLERHGELSPAARRWLRRRRARGSEDYGADFRFSQQFEEPWPVAEAMWSPAGRNYGGFGSWLQSGGGESPYALLARWSNELADRALPALDAGCGGGGLLARVASRFPLVVGLDLSFLAALLARRAVLHLPEAERAYRLTRWRGDELQRPLALERARGAEVVVADCTAAPFPPGLFGSIFSSNVIDMAGLDGPLDEATRLLSPGGLLFLSDPFFFRKGHEPEGEPVQALRSALAERGLRIEQEQDGVPWTWATYQRHWHVYFNYCAAARLRPE